MHLPYLLTYILTHLRGDISDGELTECVHILERHWPQRVWKRVDAAAERRRRNAHLRHRFRRTFRALDGRYADRLKQVFMYVRRSGTIRILK